MSCPHDWQPGKPGSAVHVCTRCAAVTYDPAPAARITDNQATALGFGRNDRTGLLDARDWTFHEEVFRGSRP